MTATTTLTFPAQLAAARDAVNWATQAAAPLPASLLETLRNYDPIRFAAAEQRMNEIATAIPHLTAIRDALESRACHRCNGSGEYAGRSGYTRNGHKYCFTCGGTGETKRTAA